MKAGDLNRRITIQARDTGEDEAGQPVTTWTTYTKTWADVRGISGLTAIRNGIPADVQGVSFRLRYRTDLTFALRVCLNDENDDPIESDPFDIQNVLKDVKGKEWTDLVSIVGANDG